MTENRYSDISENLKAITHNIEEAALRAGRNPGGIALMAVTKTVPAETVNIAISMGVRLLGENRAQELLAKYDDYDKTGVSIHFIGRLQTNKVRQVIGKVDMVHSLDSLRLAAEIERRAGAENDGKRQDVLIEVNAGGEDTKSGVSPDTAMELAEALRNFPHVNLRGLMTIPPICDNIYDSERYFYSVQKLFIDIKAKNGDNRNIDILSMGMSGDYPLAIKHGSNLVRIGSALFGPRNRAV